MFFLLVLYCCYFLSLGVMPSGQLGQFSRRPPLLWPGASGVVKLPLNCRTLETLSKSFILLFWYYPNVMNTRKDWSHVLPKSCDRECLPDLRYFLLNYVNT